MESILQNLVVALVPILLKDAEQALKLQINPNDQTWVHGLINEIVGLIKRYIPEWLEPSVEEVEQIVAAEIEKLLGMSS